MKRAIVYLGMILISQNLFSQEGEDNQQLQTEEIGRASCRERV